ncbi:DUF1064 domain-containing protein [Candidatus Dependentiae bacterium]|nr:DUF1064 domain-containing protein [Candidatus Dependentiae bacterium]
MTIRFLKHNGRPRHKFGAIPCERDGKKFPSKLEARYYDKLLMLQSSGQVIFFLRQIPFDLPGSVRYVCDFQVFYSNGEVSFIDTKGKDTPLSQAKRKIVEDLYPIRIEIVSKV